MSWLAIWLIGTAGADLTHSVRPMRRLPGLVGAVAALIAGLMAGLTSGQDVVVLLALAAAVPGWDAAVRHGFGTGRVGVPLLLWGGIFLALVLAAGAASPAGGVLDSWREASPFGLAHVDADHLLLGLGVVLAQLSTGNVMVRLVLTGTGTVNPARGIDAGRTLKGGRLLGPMERLLIVGLGLAGEIAAAGLVIAAKGLLRWPEIQSRRSATDGPGVDELTEYFLLGSFVSWLWALGGLALIA